MINLRNISMNYKEKELFNNFTYQFRENNFYALIGSNGSGKSTVLKIIAGIIKPSSGEVFIEGYSLKDEKNRLYLKQQTLCYIDQFCDLVMDLTVEENLLLLKHISEQPIKEEHYIELLKKGNLFSRRHVLVKKLSGGEKKKLSLIKLLIQNKKILLIDELTTAIKFSEREDIFRLLCENVKDKIVIIVTHDLELANEFADQIINMDNKEKINEQFEEIEENKEPVKIMPYKICPIILKPILKKNLFLNILLIIFVAIVFFLSFMSISFLTFSQPKEEYHYFKEINPDYAEVKNKTFNDLKLDESHFLSANFSFVSPGYHLGSKAAFWNDDEEILSLSGIFANTNLIIEDSLFSDLRHDEIIITDAIANILMKVLNCSESELKEIEFSYRFPKKDEIKFRIVAILDTKDSDQVVIKKAAIIINTSMFELWEIHENDRSAAFVFNLMQSDLKALYKNDFRIIYNGYAFINDVYYSAFHYNILIFPIFFVLFCLMISLIILLISSGFNGSKSSLFYLYNNLGFPRKKLELLSYFELCVVNILGYIIALSFYLGFRKAITFYIVGQKARDIGFNRLYTLNFWVIFPIFGLLLLLIFIINKLGVKKFVSY